MDKKSCKYFPCYPGQKCKVTKGKPGCVSTGKVPCAAIRCASPYQCVEKEGQGSCQPRPCSLIRCAAPYHCVEKGTKGSCELTTPPCHYIK